MPKKSKKEILDSLEYKDIEEGMRIQFLLRNKQCWDKGEIVTVETNRYLKEEGRSGFCIKCHNGYHPIEDCCCMQIKPDPKKRTVDARVVVFGWRLITN